MDINVTYHWSHLEYAHPGWKQDDTWGPIASIKITAKMETPFLREGAIWGTYDVFKYVIKGDAGDPRDQIVKAVQHYADEHNIEIQFDFLKRWEEKKPNSMDWDEIF